MTSETILKVTRLIQPTPSVRWGVFVFSDHSYPSCMARYTNGFALPKVKPKKKRATHKKHQLRDTIFRQAIFILPPCLMPHGRVAVCPISFNNVYFLIISCDFSEVRWLLDAMRWDLCTFSLTLPRRNRLPVPRPPGGHTSCSSVCDACLLRRFRQSVASLWKRHFKALKIDLGNAFLSVFFLQAAFAVSWLRGNGGNGDATSWKWLAMWLL